jgi:hypothetical protein
MAMQTAGIVRAGRARCTEAELTMSRKCGDGFKWSNGSSDKADRLDGHVLDDPSVGFQKCAGRKKRLISPGRHPIKSRLHDYSFLKSQIANRHLKSVEIVREAAAHVLKKMNSCQSVSTRPIDTSIERRKFV